ncbi:probable cyclic nucleotide-gated ion channel 20, chloroplastic [Asparagus officinalis]|nr:probable cyclic nucleotide-gated ion channel 20, chloroplastic [Asparagus officinalis]XP_020273947.1 probable cyclic nucleotide-gated ion channel 20, chloroplastic [Asparagus officinalis]
MADSDKIPMLSDNYVKSKKYTARSASMSSPVSSSYESDDAFISHTGPLRGERSSRFIPMSGPLFIDQKPEGAGPHLGKQRSKPFVIVPEEMGESGWKDSGSVGKHEHLLKSGPLGLCNNPDCTTCPATYKTKRSTYKGSLHLDAKLRNILYGDSEGWKRKFIAFFNSSFPIMNPHTKVVQQWNKFFVISCLVAIFIDPLFFYLFSVQKYNKCIVLNWSLATSIAVVRSVTDFIYLLHIFLQFRLAYVAPESRVVGAGALVDQPKKIAVHYLRGYFLLDLFVVLPLPQVMILAVIPTAFGSSAANFAKSLLRATVLLQYVPRIVRFLPLLAGQSASGFIFESAWANFVINLLMFVLAGHVVGSCWYLFGLQRVNKCLQDACSMSNVSFCKEFIDCGTGGYDTRFESTHHWDDWRNDNSSTNCFDIDAGFDYGIYEQAVLLSTKHSIVTRYIYSLFWGFQQISTLAGNVVPSYFEWEVLFTMAIVGLGLLLFALLIGNMQNFLQALGRRRLEMQLRRRDVEQWMSHRRLPERLRRHVRQAERFSWAATRGVDEEQLLANLPEDLQREIRRHFFKCLKQVRIFTLMDEPIIDAICEKLRQQFYIRGSDILYQGGPVEKMVFIVRGKVESIGVDGHKAPLSEGDVCGEELLTWYLEHSSVHKDGAKVRFPGHRLFSTRTVKCLTNVEAFALRAADLEEVTVLFARFLRNPRVQGAIRYESPYWRNMAAVRIQVAWKYRQKRLKRIESHKSGSSHSTSCTRR